MTVPMDVAATAPAKNPPHHHEGHNKATGAGACYQPTAANETAFILGGTTQSFQDSLFEVLFEQLVAFRMVFGHCLVPLEDAENNSTFLARWVVVQRTQHFEGRMKAAHAERLESIGFSWNPPLVVPQKLVVASNHSKKINNKNKVVETITTTTVDPTASLVPANERQEIREQKEMRSILSAVFLNTLKTTTPNEEILPDVTKASQEATNQEARDKKELVEQPNESGAAPRAESSKMRADASAEEIVTKVVESGLEEPNHQEAARNLEELAESESNETEAHLLANKSNNTRTEESIVEEDYLAPKLTKKTEPTPFEKSFEHLTTGRRTSTSMTGPQVWAAVELERNGATTSACQEESVAARFHNFKYPIGTRIDKEFDRFGGWFSGKVVGYRDDFYHVLYEDGDEEEFEDDEISNFVSPFQDEVDDIASDGEESSAFEMNNDDLELMHYSREESSQDDWSSRPLKKRRTWSKKSKTSRKHVVSGKCYKDSIPPSRELDRKTPSDQGAAYNKTYNQVAWKETADAQKDSGAAVESQQKDKNRSADMPGLMDEKYGVREQVVGNNDLLSSRDGGNAEAVSKTRAVPRKSSGQMTGGTKRRAEEDPQASQGNTKRSLSSKPDEELQHLFRTSSMSFINVRNKKHLTKDRTSKIAGYSPENQSAFVSAGVSHAVPRKVRQLKERQLHGLANPANGRVMLSKTFPESNGSSQSEFLAEAPPRKKKGSYKPKSSPQKTALSCSKSSPQKSHWSASAKRVFGRSNNRQTTIHHDNVMVKRAWESRHPVISEMSTAPTCIPQAPPQNENKTQKAKVKRMTLKSICYTIESEEEKYGGH